MQVIVALVIINLRGIIPFHNTQPLENVMLDNVEGQEVVVKNTSFLKGNSRRKNDGKNSDYRPYNKRARQAEVIKPHLTLPKSLRPLKISKNQDKLPRVNSVICPPSPTVSVKMRSSTVQAYGREPGRERQVAHNAVFLA